MFTCYQFGAIVLNVEGGYQMQSKLLILRKQNSLSQDDVAKWLGITAKTYGLKERGQAPFDGDEMFILSQKFHKPIEDIFLPRSHQNGDRVNV